jgi:hypothetical protein
MPCNFVVWDMSSAHLVLDWSLDNMSAAHLVLDWSLDIACSFCRLSWLIWSCTRQGRTAIFCLISWAWDHLLTRYKSLLFVQTLIVASPYWKDLSGFGSYEYSHTAFFRWSCCTKALSMYTLHFPWLNNSVLKQLLVEMPTRRVVMPGGLPFLH